MDLKTLEIHDIETIVDRYPWFAAARMELVEKMSCMGPDFMEQALKESALYFYSRADLARSATEAVKAAKEREQKNKGKDGNEAGPTLEADSKGLTLQEKARAAGYVLVGGDYFSKSELDKAEKEADGKSYYERFHDNSKEVPENGSVEQVCTETLAEIYAKQALTNQAIDVYSKLILLYPEKSSYFAALIEDLKQTNN
ncbi:MAG: hypothetical protein LKK19_00600 [Bacteroidales bacterium]|nr:hypothetical protein [Bacteroidales bacterium]MCI2121189.1 hypothetical protein [Bacteroidales bacterium]MCI2145023.1 hypothetical protein [Bacteroidales bacterium]